MNATQIAAWTAIVKGLLTIAAILIGGLWAWSRFVLERGLLPPSQMNIDLTTVGSSELATMVDIAVRIANKGSSSLIVTDLRLRLRYLNEGDVVEVVSDPSKASFGHLKFPHAHVLGRVGAEERPLRRDEEKIRWKEGAKAPKRKSEEPEEAGAKLPERKSEEPDQTLREGEFLMLPHDTFVQPGVEQSYNFVTAFPRTATYVLARATFRYRVRPSKVQVRILRVSRLLGLLQFSLGSVSLPHSIEGTFKIR